MSLTAAFRRARMPATSPQRARAGLSAEDLVVDLGGIRVLDDVSVSARPGEILALVGPNGAGKSTLLATLSGELRPLDGVVRLDRRDLSQWSPAEAAMRRAVLLQQVTLSFPFTVREVVEMGRAPWRGTALEDEDDDAVDAAMRQTEVTSFSARRFGTLSGGEKARAALARVLAQRTGVLLLDEPTAALDLHHQELVIEVARDRARSGAAVVVVLHDLNLAAAHADRVTVLAEGRVAAEGTPDDVLTDALLSAVYQHDVEVVAHPRTGTPVILPRR